MSLVPSWTETLYSWGFDAEIVGVTKWCVHPRELVAKVEKVGGTKDPNVARIVTLAPDLVVCEREENRKEDVEALRAAGVPVFLSDVRDLDGARRDILMLGEATGKHEAAQTLVARFDASLREVAAARAAPDVPVYVPIWRRPWMTLTRDTYAHHVLAAAGALNVFADAGRSPRHAGAPAGATSAEAEGRYPERGPEEAIEAGARAALLPSEPYPFHKMEDAAIKELVEAGFPRERILHLDGEALTWYGARAVEGVRIVARTVSKLR